MNENLMSNEEVRYPSVESAKQLLIEKFGEGLTFTEDMTGKTKGYATVSAYRGQRMVGKAVMGRSTATNSSPRWTENSGIYKWFIK